MPADEEDEGSDIDGGSAEMNNEENEYTRGVSDDEDEIAAREDDNDGGRRPPRREPWCSKADLGEGEQGSVEAGAADARDLCAPVGR